MSLSKKYNCDINDIDIVKKLPNEPDKYLYILRPIEGKYDDDKLYKNELGGLKKVAYKAIGFSSLLLFLKKYRANPELLPKNLKHEYPFDDTSSEDIYKAMQLMLKPMNSFEEFKQRLLLSTKELAPKEKKEKGFRFGEKLVFINKKENCGNAINMYGELIPILKEYNETYWEDAILFDKEKKIFEYYVKPERTNDTPSRDNWRLHIKFYEEKYLYEYLLNEEIGAVR
ncbi:hypothetical protein [Sulfurimonas sp.]|uniref:hypothetical protein n=1 Tax=Sulfurimonas sp. TaxID=2022749 RepID=UPI002B465770|nr:hypothetical protein [Sulfurimonas sp.]